MTAADWAGQYIGIPWVAGAQGPDAYDCMGFFGRVQRTHFGIDVPQIIAPDFDDPTVLVNLFRTHEEKDNWVRTEKLTHGCAVLVHRPMHIGTWLDIDGGGVLHSVKGIGVIFTPDASWPVSGFGRREIYVHKV